MLSKIILIVLIAAAMLLSYGMYTFWGVKINPRKSIVHFIGYLIANIVTIFAVVFIFAFVVIYFKEFFISK